MHNDLPKLPVIIMTAHSDLESAVSSYQSGAFDYLPKPFDVDDAMAMVRRAVTHAHEQKSEHVPEEVGPTEIIGQAPAMQEVFRAIGRLSAFERHGADQRRIGQRQGTRRARIASTQSARGSRRSSR